jgi:hypothetical protein
MADIDRWSHEPAVKSPLSSSGQAHIFVLFILAESLQEEQKVLDVHSAQKLGQDVQVGGVVAKLRKYPFGQYISLLYC